MAKDSEGAARDHDALKNSFQTIEAALTAENWFLEKIRNELAKVAPLDSFPTISGTNGHDYLLHFTQFLFFFKALDCTKAEQISAFIDGHNAKLEADIAKPGFSKSEREFRKAIFGRERKKKIEASIRSLQRPVFAIYEHGHLLIDEMSPKTTEKLIEDLRYGKLLEHVKDEDIAADPRRILIASTGFLEETYMTSLLVQRRLIAQGMDEAEFSQLQGSE